MPLLQSLICFRGFDTGRRFLLISIGCYLCFLLLSPMLAKSSLLLALLLATNIPILIATSLRRLRDAGFSKFIAIVSPITFLLSVLTITYSQHGASWFLLLVALLTSVAMASLNNPKIRKNHSYVYGYAGPIDLSIDVNTAQKNAFHHQRIEPTLATSGGEKFATRAPKNPADKSISAEFAEGHKTDNKTNIEITWEQKLGERFSANALLTIGLILSGAILVIVVIINLLDSDDKIVDKTETMPVAAETTRQRLNKIEMPDNFWVMQDQNDAVTIGWQGDIKKDGEIWSIDSAKGDKDCSELSFGAKDRIRSLRVNIKNNGDYYADFSPLDTKTIIQAIALGTQFKLCGYEFSLKGTQAKLMNNQKYASYFD